jgi:hypothetical protein
MRILASHLLSICFTKYNHLLCKMLLGVLELLTCFSSLKSYIIFANGPFGVINEIINKNFYMFLKSVIKNQF